MLYLIKCILILLYVIQIEIVIHKTKDLRFVFLQLILLSKFNLLGRIKMPPFMVLMSMIHMQYSKFLKVLN